MAGDPYSCLGENHSVAITESKAMKYFADNDALGKTLIINKEPKVITGVIKDLPGNSHLKFSILCPRMEDGGWERENNHRVSAAYWQPSVFTYVLFPENYKPETFVERFKMVYEKYLKGFGTATFLYEIAFETRYIVLDSAKLRIHFRKCGADGSKKRLEPQHVLLEKGGRTCDIANMPWKVRMVEARDGNLTIAIHKK